MALTTLDIHTRMTEGNESSRRFYVSLETKPALEGIFIRIDLSTWISSGFGDSSTKQIKRR